MTDSAIEAINKAVEALDEQYAKDFAGQNRATVDIGRIEALIVKAKEAYKDAEAKLAAMTDNDAAQAALRAVDERKQLFEREHRLISMRKKMGPSFDKFVSAGIDANVVFGTYTRHFAGQDRGTRDVGLLNECIEDLKGIQKRMTAIVGKKAEGPVSDDLSLVKRTLEQYQSEAKQITSAIQSGTTNEQADRLATLANNQFALYATHFAGQSRVTRRPQLLKRIIDSLRRHRAAMFALKNGGFSSEANSNNIDIVDQRVKGYETELEEIRKTRKANKLADIMGALGGTANELFEEYRRDFADKQRTDVSLEQLGVMLDKLCEIRRQMAELGRVEKNESNERNQVIVTDYLRTWMNEYNLIREAQTSALSH